jgi:succinoglycan biosynthesis transport protein ExoP
MNQLKQPDQKFQPLQQNPVDGAPIDLRHLFDVVMHYKWSILGFAFAISLAAGFWVFSLEPVFRATASIVLESQQANVVNLEDVYSVDPYDYNYSQTQYEILKSRNLAERVVRRLELQRHPAFVATKVKEREPWYHIDLKRLLPVSKKEPPVQLTAEEREDLVVQSISGAITSRLQIVPVEYSYVVYLSYDSMSARLAAQVVNAVAEEFIKGNLENRLDGTLQATDWLEVRLDSLKQSLRQSEKDLQDFREREGLVDVGGVTGLGGNELTTLSQRLQEASKTRIETQNIKEDVQGMKNASTDELMTIPAVLLHQLVSDLKRVQSSAERKAAELGKRYGTRHPKMIAAQSDLNEANANLAREVRKVVSGISREYEVALRNEQQLQANWKSRKSEMQNFNRVEFQLEELQREVEASRQLYDIFFTRLKGVSETGGFAKPHARIVDRALIPGGAIKPNKSLSIMLAFILGIVLGCVVAIVLDMLDNTIKSPDDVPLKLHVPLLGSVPLQKLDRSGTFPQLWQDLQSSFAEAIRTIRTGVVLSGLDEPSRVIVVTSTVSGEGKSTVALNLASALGQMERTLIIGGDLRRPSLAKMAGLAPGHQGLSQFVAGNAELEDCMEHLQDLNIHVMPCGVIPPNPLEMISSNKFVDALKSLLEKFDRIVIDSAPVQVVSDALILASYASSVIYVVKADSTPATQIQKGIASIMGSNEPFTGVVLNYFDAKRATKYYPGEYYQGEDGSSNYRSTQVS